MQSGIETCIS